MLPAEPDVLHPNQNGAPQTSGFLNPLWRILIVLIGVAIFISGIYLLSGSSTDQHVTLSVLSVEDGTRTLVDYSLPTGALTKRGVSNEVQNSRTLSDGSVIEVQSAGLVKKQRPSSTSFELLVTSPVSAPATTPFAVWGNGARLAWVSPADNSVQVFEKSSRGAYVPVRIQSTLFPNSIQFSNDGSELFLTKLKGGSTEMYRFVLQTGEVEKLTTLDGLATLVNNQ